MNFDGNLTGTLEESDVSLSQPIRFWIFLVLFIPSVYCSLVLLFHLLTDKHLRSQLNNHIIILLLIIGLIIELIDIPFHLSFLHMGVVQPSTPLFCLVWLLFDLGLYNGCTIIMAWGSIQRYLLIFHDQLFRNTSKRLLLHYLPLTILTVYVYAFYFIVIVFPPCMNIYDYTLPVCGNSPCYLQHSLLGLWDSIVNSIVPTIIITVFSIMVLIRVYIQKRRLHQLNLWRKQRKMTMQLLSMCTLYLIGNVPLNIVIFAHVFGLPDQYGIDVENYANFFCYFVTLLFPFICLSILSELRRKIQWKGILLFRRSHRNVRINPT